MPEKSSANGRLKKSGRSLGNARLKTKPI
jgi:hypothetical protein